MDLPNIKSTKKYYSIDFDYDNDSKDDKILLSFSNEVYNSFNQDEEYPLELTPTQENAALYLIKLNGSSGIIDSTITIKNNDMDHLVNSCGIDKIKIKNKYYVIAFFSFEPSIAGSSFFYRIFTTDKLSKVYEKKVEGYDYSRGMYRKLLKPIIMDVNNDQTDEVLIASKFVNHGSIMIFTFN